MDGRTDLYDDVFVRRYVSVMVADEQWEDILAEDGIRTILIERHSIVAKLLAQHPDWQQVYEDDMASIFVRNE